MLEHAEEARLAESGSGLQLRDWRDPRRELQLTTSSICRAFSLSVGGTGLSQSLSSRFSSSPFESETRRPRSKLLLLVPSRWLRIASVLSW